MTIDTALQDAKRRIARLDFSAENARVADINQQLADIEAALQRARDRHEEILQLLRPFNGAHHLAASPVVNDHDGRPIGDALLAGEDTSEAAEQRPNRDKLERERVALREGMADLAGRTRVLDVERQKVKAAAARRAYDQVQPLCEALEAEAREGARAVVRNFAALSALGRATQAHPPGLNAAATAMAGVRGPGMLVSAVEAIEAPAEVMEIIELIADKGHSQVGRVNRSVDAPPHQVTAALVAPRQPQLLPPADQGFSPVRSLKRLLS
jgi:hypothetical protein